MKFNTPNYLKEITHAAPRAARKATQRHIAGDIGYSEWIAELRSMGLSVASGGTRLTIEQQDQRRANLSRRCPRLRKLVQVYNIVSEAAE